MEDSISNNNTTAFIQEENIPRLTKPGSDKLILDMDGISVEERYQRLKIIHAFGFQSGHQGSVEVDLNTFNSHVDENIKIMLGYDKDFPNDIITWTNLIHPDEMDLIIEEVMKLASNPAYYFNLNIRLKCSNHKYLWFMARGYVACTKESEGSHRDSRSLIAVLTNIHELKSTERKLERLTHRQLSEINARTSELEVKNEQFQLIAKIAKMVIVIIKKIAGEYRIMKFLSDNEVFGEDYSKFEGYAISSFFNRTEYEFVCSELANAVDSNCRFETKLDNPSINVEVYAEYIDSDTTDAFLVGVRDTTQWVHLIETKQIFTRVLGNAIAEIFIVDTEDFKHVYINDYALFKLGFSDLDEVNSMPNHASSIPTREMQKLIAPVLSKQVDSMHLKTRNFRKDGTSYPVKQYIQRSTYHGKSVLFIMCIDITEVEREKKRAETLAREHTLGQLTSSMCHEINNPLANIYHGIEHLSETPKDELTHEELVETVEMLKGQADRIKSYIDKLSSFKKSKSVESQSSGALSDTIEDILSLNRIEYQSKKIQVKLNELPNLPLVLHNKADIQQAIVILLTNSIDSGANEIEVKLGLIQETKHVFIAVKDNGKGIKKELINGIFDRGFTTKHLTGGTGIGLELCHNIIKSHDGNITVESELGVGTTFTIRIPVDRQPLLSHQFEAEF